jgi:cytochrome P450
MTATTTPYDPAELQAPPAPTPRRRPPDLFAFLHAARNNPLLSWTEEHFTAPFVVSKGVLGRVMTVNDPQAVKRVLLDAPELYVKDDLQRRVLAPGLGDGLLTADGEEWKLQRRALAPLFNPRVVTGFLPAMNEAADRLVSRWTRRPGRRLDVALEMTRVTLDVLERTIFTAGLSRDPDALGRAVTRYFEALGPIDPLDVFGMPAWVPRVGRWRAQPAIRFFEDVVGELISARRALIASGGAAPRDLLTLLIEASDPETGRGLSDVSVAANVVTFIGAGHETTANALSWTMFLLSRDDGARERLTAEIDEVLGDRDIGPEDLARLPFTRAVLEEAMRLYPPVPFMSRAAVAEDRLGPFRVPRGTLVIVAPYVLHRHHSLWEEPSAFRPERFLPENRGSIDRFAYLPFGAGPRVCIGASFSLQEAIVVLAKVVRAVTFEMERDHVVTPVHRVTLRPEGGVPMRIVPRRP